MSEEKKDQHIEIQLSNGYKLVAERNRDPEYDQEIMLGVQAPDGSWVQDLAVVRAHYTYDTGDDGVKIHWHPDMFDILLYADERSEDITEKVTVNLRRDVQGEE